MIIATVCPDSLVGPKASYVTCCNCSSPLPAALASVASILSLGNPRSLAFFTSMPSRTLWSGSKACEGEEGVVELVGALAMYCLMLEMISREIVPYDAPFAASLAAFLCLILDHWRESDRVRRWSGQHACARELTLFEPDAQTWQVLNGRRACCMKAGRVRERTGSHSCVFILFPLLPTVAPDLTWKKPSM